MGTMNVSLPDDLIQFVRDETERGGYGNNSDVVRDGLRLLRERREKRQALRLAIAEGDADIAAARTNAVTVERLRDITERARQRGRVRRGEA